MTNSQQCTGSSRGPSASGWLGPPAVEISNVVGPRGQTAVCGGRLVTLGDSDDRELSWFPTQQPRPLCRLEFRREQDKCNV